MPRELPLSRGLAPRLPGLFGIDAYAFEIVLGAVGIGSDPETAILRRGCCRGAGAAATDLAASNLHAHPQSAPTKGRCAPLGILGRRMRFVPAVDCADGQASASDSRAGGCRTTRASAANRQRHGQGRCTGSWPHRVPAGAVMYGGRRYAMRAKGRRSGRRCSAGTERADSASTGEAPTFGSPYGLLRCGARSGHGQSKRDAGQLELHSKICCGLVVYGTYEPTTFVH